MKYKVLSSCVLAAMLMGCNDDEVIKKQFSVQAYDGAIYGMIGTANCGNGAIAMSDTDFDGYARVDLEQLGDDLSECSFKFEARSGAVDTSNGKSMAGLSLAVPKGLADAGTKVTASPITTLLAKQLGDTPYSEEAASEVLELIMPDFVTQTGLTVEALITDLEGATKQLSDKQQSTLIATTHVLADTLKATGNASVQEIANITVNMTDSVLASNANYPLSDDGEQIFVDVTETVESNKDILVKDPAEFNPEEVPAPKPQPSNPPSPELPPPTGGTGGSGSGGDGGA